MPAREYTESRVVSDSRQYAVDRKVAVDRLAVEPSADWSPLDLTNLWFWVDPVQITGLNDGDPVVTWEDLGPNGYDVTQAVPGAQPTYRTAVQNGLPVVRCDGGDVLAATVVSPGPHCTIFAVALTTSFNIWKHVVCCEAAGNNRNFQMMISNAAKLVKGFSDGPASWRNILSTAAFQVATFHLCVGAYDGTDQLVALDEVDETLPFGQVPVASTNLTVAGSVFSGAEGWIGDLGDIIICDADPLPAGERALAINYLINKWAI